MTTTAIRPWTPRLPLSLAEQAVDYPAHRTHIDQRRVTVEQATVSVARRVGVAATFMHGHPPLAVIDELTARLARSLDATAAFGYRQARTELARLRDNRPRDHAVQARHVFTDQGRYAHIARGGLEAIRRHVRQRAHEAALLIAAAAAAAITEAEKTATVTRVELVLLAAAAATRLLHNAILELVGETLNLGRTAGALEAPDGPPRYAMRSEQLDENTCDVCDEIHGTIVEIDSVDFDALMPPSECLGGGRCRGVYVFGDEQADVEMPEAA